MNSTAFHNADILVPKESVDTAKWSVIACDQYTSEPEYWDQVYSIVGDAPSTLNLILPELYLERGRCCSAHQRHPQVYGQVHR